jgi:hypothetical protein
VAWGPTQATEDAGSRRLSVVWGVKHVRPAGGAGRSMLHWEEAGVQCDLLSLHTSIATSMNAS